MKVLNILAEIHYADKLERDGFKLEQDEERDDDVIKIFHYITSPDGKKHFIDHNPYNMISQATFDKYIAFYKKHKRFPRREDLHMRSPLNDKSIDELVATLEESEGELLPRKAHESTARKIAGQLVRAAGKHFDGDKHLRVAKQMAREFHKRLVQNIETEHRHMNLKDIKEVDGEFTLSLTEVHHQKYYDDDDWQEDYAEDTGMSATCPRCGSDDVHQDDDGAAKDRIMAAKHKCENCGHESKWWGPYAHHAQAKYGGRGHHNVVKS